LVRSEKQIHPEAVCLIFCEGRDEEYFFRAFQSWCKKENPDVEGIQFWDCGGIANIRNEVRAVIGIDGFEHIRAVGIIRDAEKDADAAVDSIRSILKEFFVAVPEDCFCVQESCMKDQAVTKDALKIGFAVLPGLIGKDKEDRTGTLEDLCYEIFHLDKLDKTDGQIFLEKVEKKKGSPFQRKHKNLLHIQFSVTDAFVGKKIGEAAKCDAFDFQHDAMLPFGGFFRELTKV